MSVKRALQKPFSYLLFHLLLALPSLAQSQGFEGYYRFPDVHENKIVFVAEGDLYTVPLSGGLAKRLTTHAELERNPKFSPDGKTIAYTASYEGPSEVYTIPIDGGSPLRWTYESDLSLVNGWTPDGKIVYDTRANATLPDRQLVTIDVQSKKKERVPLSQASEASYNNTGNTVYFVRPSYHGNVTKRYKGGTARQIWKYTNGKKEAEKLTTDFAGGSHHPMWFNNRIYFISDRDGTMNIWSMNENGADMNQHTTHTDFDVRSAGIDNNNIVYQVGADLWHYDLNSNSQNKIEIRLATDLEQLKENWVDNPANYISSVQPDKAGEKILITARGRVFVAPVNDGRLVEFTDKKNIRYRDATFSSDGKNIYTLSDESGEFEFVSMPSNGIGDHAAMTNNGDVLRYAGIPSPDGKWLAFDDLENNLFVLNISSGESKKISTNEEGIGSFSWSSDSKWLAFVQYANNTMSQILVHGLSANSSFSLTTDRANSTSPQWSPDGKFIYFISDRSFTTIVGSPWGTRQPEPYFDASEKLYHIALQKGTRSPFRQNDELASTGKKDEAKDDITVVIDQDGISGRITEIPVSPGNYRGLAVTNNAIYTLSSGTGVGSSTDLSVVKITNEDVKITSMVDGVRSFTLTQNGKKLLVRKGRDFFMVNAGTGKIGNLNDGKINLNGWKFAITPREDWKQIFTDAWRMERDYFYDKNMHGVDWNAMYDKYFPLTDRVTTREELSDLIGRYVGELSVLHTSVRGGEQRSDNENINVASFGGRFSRDEKRGGYKIDHIYKADPDYPNERSPLDDPFLDIQIGDVITHVNGKKALDAVDIGELIRNQANKQVHINYLRGKNEMEAVVLPIGNAYGLRYDDWEYTRRLEVEKNSQNKIGYVHLQAMGANDINQWYREFYPVFDRPGLIVDVRHNRGGNIESFILEKLLRKAWMFWKSRSGNTTWNMQYAFRGHIVILVDENTASDGEAFADGFKKLGLGTAIGMRTWGGEVWLSGVNTLSDGGVARAPMTGVFGADGTWLIEGHGFEPDIVVDNPPHATFNGQDAQLQAAIKLLEKLIKEDPRAVPPVPAYPDKSFKNNKK